MDKINLAYWIGVKVGVQSLLEALRDTANKNGNQLPIEFIELVVDNNLADIDLRLNSMEGGKELVEKLKQSFSEEGDTRWNNIK